MTGQVYKVSPKDFWRGVGDSFVVFLLSFLEVLGVLTAFYGFFDWFLGVLGFLPAYFLVESPFSVQVERELKAAQEA